MYFFIINLGKQTGNACWEEESYIFVIYTNFGLLMPSNKKYEKFV